MQKSMPCLRRFFISAPFIVAVGMAILILGGVAGGRWFTEREGSSGSAYINHAAVFEAFNASPVPAQRLIRDVDVLKSEVALLLSEEHWVGSEKESSVMMLGYTDEAQSDAFVPRRDPFAPVAPPDSASALPGKKMSPASKRVGISHPKALARGNG